MSTPIRTRLPVSPVNAGTIGLILAGALGTALVGHWRATVVLLLGAVAIFVMARYARRPEARDITRINATEYRDERDWRIAQGGLSAVGATALIVVFVEFLVLLIVLDDDEPPAALLVVGGHALLLFSVWAIANSRIANRS